MRRTAGIGALVALCVLLLPTAPARADVALCASFPTPRSESRALERAPFAFEGVAVDGRETDESGLRARLVSPLTFRVTRWIKGDRSHEVALPSGGDGIHIWDGRYARLPDRVLETYDPTVTIRFTGELVARPGQVWRIYATEENGVDFTCTNLLGSHPLEQTASTSRPTSRAAGPSGSTGWGPGLIVTLVAAGVAVLLLALVALARSRTGRRRR